MNMKNGSENFFGPFCVSFASANSQNSREARTFNFAQSWQFRRFWQYPSRQG
jgi:hypothetical protein